MLLSKQDVQQSVERTRKFGKRAVAYAAAAAVVTTTSVASADFSGDYAPGNWTTTTGSPDASVANDGLVAILTGTDAGANDVLEYSITASAGTTSIDFDWSYTNLLGDYGSYDYAGFLVDGDFTLLATNDDVSTVPGPGSISGSESVAVSAGQSFAFVVVSLDGNFGAGELTIGNFDASVPEPSALGLLAAGTIGGLLAGRRRKGK